MIRLTSLDLFSVLDTPVCSDQGNEFRTAWEVWRSGLQRGGLSPPYVKLEPWQRRGRSYLDSTVND